MRKRNRFVYISFVILCLSFFLIYNTRYQSLHPNLIPKVGDNVAKKLNTYDNQFANDTSRGIISVLETKYIIKQEQDILHLVLTARDSSGNPCTQGGDFFFATLSDLKEKRWTAGKVIDYDNGTYSIYFYVGWGGSVNIDVTLVNLREDVLWIKNVYRPLEGKPKLYGTFKRIRNVLKGRGICTVRRNSKPPWEKVCVYRNENSFGKSFIVCSKPKYFFCQDLKFLGGLTTKKVTEKKRPTSKLSSGSGVIDGTNGLDQFSKWNKSNYMVPFLKNLQINLIGQKRNSKEWPSIAAKKSMGLPECGPGLAEPVSDGYWSNNAWNSLVCNSKQWRKPEILACLRDKDIYFIGDSTIRQWYEQLIVLLGYKENRKEILNKLYRHRYNKPYNFNVTFRMHKWYGSKKTYLATTTKYMADFVDSLIELTCNYIVLVTASFHFPEWTRESYGEMLMKTKEAIDRLLKRCPNSIIIVKGSHPRGDRKNQWILYDMNLHMRQIFAKHPRIFFIDVWDMVLSYPYSEMVHMPASVINQELFLSLSYIKIKESGGNI